MALAFGCPMAPWAFCRLGPSRGRRLSFCCLSCSTFSLALFQLHIAKSAKVHGLLWLLLRSFKLCCLSFTCAWVCTKDFIKSFLLSSSAELNLSHLSTSLTIPYNTSLKDVAARFLLTRRRCNLLELHLWSLQRPVRPVRMHYALSTVRGAEGLSLYHKVPMLCPAAIPAGGSCDCSFCGFAKICWDDGVSFRDCCCYWLCCIRCVFLFDAVAAVLPESEFWTIVDSGFALLRCKFHVWGPATSTDSTFGLLQLIH